MSRNSVVPPRIRELDWLVGAVVCLCCLGLVMAVSIRGFDPSVGPLMAMRAQGTKVLVGLAAFLTGALVPLPWLQRFARPLLFGGIALCALALGFGDINGAHRWIRFGTVGFQPVELARFALVLYTAAWIARVGPRIAEFTTGFVMLMGPACVLCLVLVQQPDVGNAMFTLALAAVMAIVGGVRLRHFVLAGLPLAVPVVAMMLSRGHVQHRLSAFLDVQPGSQVGQSLIAISSGGTFGRGLGDGWMKMGFVSEAENDFVFAVIGEELGFVGGLVVIALYSAIGWVGLRLFRRMEDPFLRMLVFGFTYAVCMQASINLLVVTGMAPAKGIDLPFVSSGGTNLLFCLAAIGIVGNAARSDASAA